MRTSHPRAPRSRPTGPGGWLRALPLTLLIAVGAIGGPVVTPALAASTGISGTVTDGLSGQPASAVQVSVYDPSGALVSSTCTGSDGGYVFGGLNAGDYRVGFESTQGNFKVCGGHTNYLPAFYDRQPTLAAANTVTVVAGATTPGINAVLEPGGAIAGTATDATNSAPAANVEVDAFDGAGSLVSATCTAADGSYALFSLASGSYRVEFRNSTSCGSRSTPYRDQFYNGQTTLAAAHPVAVTVTQTTSGIDAALIPTSAKTLTVTISGPGSVAFSPSGVSCTRSCILPVTGSPTITLTGSPGSGYKLGGWSGAGCSGAFVCTVQMTGDEAVTASFVAAGGSAGSGGSGSGSGSGPGPGSGSGTGSGAQPGCTLAVVSSAVRLAAPRHTASRPSSRPRPVPPAVTVRYRCLQASRLSLRATFSFITATRGARSRHVRRQTHSAVTVLASQAVRAGSGTLTVRLPAVSVRALRSGRVVSGRFELRYSAARGSGIAVARIARLRGVR